MEEEFNKEFKRVIKQYYTQHAKCIITRKNNTAALEIKNIVYIESYQRHLYVVTKDKEKYINAGKLNEKEKQLFPLGFVRTHQVFY